MPERVTEWTSGAEAVLFDPGAVVELRAVKDGKTTSGYYDDHDALAEKARDLDERGHAVYVTLNEVNPALLARAANRARPVYREPTTSDGDIVRRRWLPLDFDPARPSGVSATDAEKEAARLRALEIRDHLEALGWPEPIEGDSGNGYHLLYSVDLPNDRESLDLVRGVLESLSFEFSDDTVGVDTKVYNAARIWKFYGTTARKGDDTPERPHRRSSLLKAPDVAEVVDREKLEAVAARRPEPSPGPRRNGHQREDFDLAAWIRRQGVPVKREGSWERDGYRWVLEECPWNGHTDNAAYIVQGPGGWIAAGCQHNSCQGFGWREFREHYEPGAYDRHHKRNGHDATGAALGDPADREPWEDPTPLPDGLPPVAPFDPALLPDALRPWCEDIAERMQVPLDYVAVGAVAVAASLVGRKVGVYPKRRDDWLVVPNLWSGIVGPPSAMKSPALAEITKPLDRLVVEAMKVHSEAEEAHEARAEAVEAEKAALKKAIDAAAKKSVETGDRSRLNELIDHRRKMEIPEPPTERRYKTSDTTIEKLVEILRDNPFGILVQRDELTGWLRSLDKQGREVDRAFYLQRCS